MEYTSELLRKAAAQGITYIDPRIDYAFKLIFGTPGNEDLLLRLVQAILPEKHVATVELSPQEQEGLRPSARRSVIDVKCKTDDGSDLIIEMQIKEQEDFSDRLIFYSSFPIINRLQRGDNGSYRLTPLYVIGITDFIIPGIPANDDMINHYSIRNVKDNGIAFSDSVHYVTVELPKLTKTLQEVKDTPEWILYTIEHLGAMKQMPKEYSDSYLEKIFRLSIFAAMDELTQEDYLARFMFEMDEKSRLRTAENKGLAKGKAEVARNLKKLGMEPSVIQQVTGLSPEQIQAL